jgi:biopolymer transport protein ExbB
VLDEQRVNSPGTEQADTIAMDLHEIFIVILILVSIIGLTFIIERGLALRWKRVIPPSVETAVEGCHSANDLPMLVQTCRDNPSPISRLLLVARDHLHWSKQSNANALEVRARHEVTRLERGLVVLEIIVGVAPLLGLVGTVYGLIILFGEMGTVGMADNTMVAKGIALALNATFLGLIGAIPSLIAWSIYSKRVETMAVEMETLCDEFLRRQYRQTKEP